MRDRDTRLALHDERLSVLRSSDKLPSVRESPDFDWFALLDMISPRESLDLLMLLFNDTLESSPEISWVNSSARPRHLVGFTR